MSGSSKKIAGVLIILLGVCAGAYVFGLPMLESQQAERIAAAIKALPGNFTAEDVKVGFFDKKVTIKGLKGKPALGAGILYDVEIGQLELQGVNLEAGSKPGVAPIAQFVKVTDSNFKSSIQVQGLEQSFSSSSTCKEMSITGLKGDLTALMALGPLPTLPLEPNEQDLRDYIKATNAMMVALSTFHIERGDFKQQTFELGPPVPLKGGIDSGAYADVSVTKCGPMEMLGLKMSVLNSETLRVEKISLQGISSPDLFSLEMDPENPDAYGKGMLAAFAANPMRINGLLFEKMWIKPMTPEAATIESSKIDIELGPEKIAFVKEVKNLNLPVSVYGMFGREGMMFASVHKQPLLINGNLDVLLNQKDGKGEILIKKAQVSENALGNVSLTGELPFEGEGGSLESLLKEGGVFSLKSAALELEDKSIVETFLTMQLRQGGAGQAPISVATLRSGMVDAIMAEAALQTSADRKLIMEGFAKLVGAPGKLTVSVTPSQPVAFDDLEDGEQELNAKVEYSPAK